VSKLSSSEIAALFAQRMPKGGWLSVKQASWLMSVYKQEVQAEMRKSGRTSYIGYSAGGSFLVDGVAFSWECNQMPNGAANFKVEKMVTVEEINSKVEAELANMRAFIDCMQAVNADASIYQFAIDRIKVLEGSK
jgi:hypothetical protein